MYNKYNATSSAKSGKENTFGHRSLSIVIGCLKYLSSGMMFGFVYYRNYLKSSKDCNKNIFRVLN